MHRAHGPPSETLSARTLPHHSAQIVRRAEHLIQDTAGTVNLHIIKMEPNRAQCAEKMADLNKSIAQHGEPDGALGHRRNTRMPDQC